MDLGLWTRFADGMKQRAIGMSLECWGTGVLLGTATKFQECFPMFFLLFFGFFGLLH